MLLPSASATDAAVLQRLEGLERRMTLAPVEAGTAAPAVPAAPAPVAAAQPARPTYQRPATKPTEAPPPTPKPEQVAEQPAPEPAAAAASAPSTMDSTAIRQIWPELLRKVGERSKPTLVLLQNATVKTVEGNTLVLAMPTAGLARQLGQESRAEVIKATLHDLVAGNWQIQCVHGDGGGSDGPGAARRPATATRSRPAAEARIAEPAPSPAAVPQQPAAAPVAERRPPTRPAPRAADPNLPPPPEPPDDEDMPPDPRDEDVSQASVRRDPDAVAVDLLTEHLRARRMS
jgi:DNA polymerase-3 subunit gamma/tau